MKIQMYADKRDMRAFYEALKGAYGPSHQVQAPLRSTDGSTLLTSKDGIIARWAELFKGLFRDHFKTQVAVFDRTEPPVPGGCHCSEQ